jgi:ABC-2 type transport system permease protein
VSRDRVAAAMNKAFFRHTWRLQRVKLGLVSLGLLIWGGLPPFIYARFGSQFQALFNSGMFPEEFARFGGGDVLSLPGAVALSLIHPIAIVLTSVFAVGFSAFAIAGERQRGTLEVVLARPLSRRTLYFTLLAASFAFVALSITALLAGSVTGSVLAGVIDQLAVRRMPLVWLNGVLLFGALAAVGLAASATFDRATPALGWTLGFGIVMYVLEVLGSLWPAAQFLQPYSLFHYLQPRTILTGAVEPLHFAVLAMVIAAAVAWSLTVFPRRDLAAPI